MLIRIRTEQRGNYVHATFHMGPAPLGSSGSLVLQVNEWEAFRKALYHGAPQADLVIEQTEMFERKVPG